MVVVLLPLLLAQANENKSHWAESKGEGNEIVDRVKKFK